MATGTAGLRALDGPGYTRMNEVTVQQATAGLLEYLEAQCAADGDGGASGNDSASHRDLFAQGIVLGFDGRTNSRL